MTAPAVGAALAAALVLSPASGAWASGAGAQDDAGAVAGAPAPDFVLRDLHGSAVRLSDLVAKGPVVIAFWATWCRPCAEEAPHLTALHRDLGARGLTVVGVSLDDATTVGDVRAFVRTQDLDHMVLLDPEGRVAALYNPEHAMPYTVLIGRQGRVRRVHRGFAPGDEVRLRAEVVALLDEPPPRDGASKPGVSWSISSQTLVERDVDGERSAGFVRPRLDASWGPMSAGVRYDLEAVRRPRADGEGEFNPCLRGRVGHSYLEYGGRKVRARAGDSHAVLGRGLLLHLPRVGAFGAETSVLGGDASATAGPLTARLFGGVTHFSEIPQTLQGNCTEIYNPIVGGRLEGRVGPVTVGVHAMRTDRAADASRDDGFHRFDPDPDASGLAGGGVTVEISGKEGGPHMYAEVAGVRSEEAVDRETGQGMYAALTVPMGPMTVSLEAKRYDRLELTYVKNEPARGFTALMPYNAPPTLQPANLAFESRPDLLDTTAARLTVDADLGGDLSANASLFQGSEADGILIQHPIVGFAYQPEGLRAAVEAGSRVFSALPCVPAPVRARPNQPTFQGAWGHAQAETAVVVSGPHSLDIVATYKSFHPDSPALEDKTDLQLVAAYIHPKFEGAIVLENRQTPTPESKDGFHPSATATWHFSSDGALVGFVGSDPGGLRCTSGVCRILPAFRGVRLETSLRF